MFLLFSGPPDSGKTSSIARFEAYLLSPAKGYTVIDRSPWSGTKCILSNGTRTVLLWCETDQVNSIKGLDKYYKAYPYVDVIVTASRDEGDPMRDKLFLYRFCLLC